MVDMISQRGGVADVEKVESLILERENIMSINLSAKACISHAKTDTVRAAHRRTSLRLMNRRSVSGAGQ